MRQVVGTLIDAAERAGWLRELVQAAYEDQPSHAGLAALYTDFGLAPPISVQRSGPEGKAGPTTATIDTIGATARGGHPTFDEGRWRERLLRIERCVCRVEVAGRPVGTGFLVGPDAVLTCFNVLEAICKGWQLPANVGCRFDARALPGGILLPGMIVKLSYHWLIDMSPYTRAEAGNRPDSVLPTADELDYVLIRLERPVGQEAVNSEGNKGLVRGWLPVTGATPEPGLDEPVQIAQYPQGGTLKVSLDMHGNRGANANHTRLRYRTSTEYGSSGAPVFDLNWDVIAVHQMREPVFDRPPSHNPGHPHRRHLRPTAAARQGRRPRRPAAESGAVKHPRPQTGPSLRSGEGEPECEKAC